MRVVLRGLVLPAVAVMATLGSAQAAWVASHIGTLGGDYTRPSAVNGQGQVVGISQVGQPGSGGPSHGFVYDRGSIFDVGAAMHGAGVSSAAFGLTNDGRAVVYGYERQSFANVAAVYDLNARTGTIVDFSHLGVSAGLNLNNRGMAVGVAYSPLVPDAPDRAFTVANGRAVALPLSGSEVHLKGLNDAGQIFGRYAPGGDLSRSQSFVIDSDGSFTDIGTLGGRLTYIEGFNNSGYAVGRATLAGGETFRAFVHVPSGAGLVDLGTLPGGHSSRAVGINDSFQVAGSADVLRPNGQSARHAVIWSGGLMHDLGSLDGSDYSEALQINNLGQVLGESRDSDGARAMFVWADERMLDLDDLVRDIGITNVLSAVLGDNGFIAGQGTRADGSYAAFLLTPAGHSQPPGTVGEPGSLALLAVALLPLLTRRAGVCPAR